MSLPRRLLSSLGLRRLIFNLWYLFRPPWNTGVSPPELMEFIEGHPPGRALDLGCGTGTNVITLARHGREVTGVDFAGRAIRAARRKARQVGVGVDLLVGDVTKAGTLAGPYDLVLDMGCFHSLPQEGRRRYAANVERLLAPEGTYMLYVFLKTAGNELGPGVTDTELAALPFKLTARREGDERGHRPSAWLTFSGR